MRHRQGALSTDSSWPQVLHHEQFHVFTITIDGSVHYFFQGPGFLREAISLFPSPLPTAQHRCPFVLAGETLNSCPAHPAAPTPSLLPFTAERGTAVSSHVFNNSGSRWLPTQPSTLWHSKTAHKNHPAWAKKSPNPELTTHQGWQTIQEADDGSLPIPLTKVTQQPPGTQQEMKSLASSSQPVLCLQSIWHELTFTSSSWSLWSPR